MEHTEKQGCPCCHKTKERSQEEYTKLIHRLNRISTLETAFSTRALHAAQLMPVTLYCSID